MWKCPQKKYVYTKRHNYVYSVKIPFHRACSLMSCNKYTWLRIFILLYHFRHPIWIFSQDKSIQTRNTKPNHINKSCSFISREQKWDSNWLTMSVITVKTIWNSGKYITLLVNALHSCHSIGIYFPFLSKIHPFNLILSTILINENSFAFLLFKNDIQSSSSIWFEATSL